MNTYNIPGIDLGAKDNRMIRNDSTQALWSLCFHRGIKQQMSKTTKTSFHIVICSDQDKTGLCDSDWRLDYLRLGGKEPLSELVTSGLRIKRQERARR